MSTLISALSISILLIMVLGFITGVSGIYFGIKKSNGGVTFLSMIPLILSLSIFAYIGYYYHLDKITVKTNKVVQAQVVNKEYSNKEYIITLKYDDFEDKICDAILYNKINEGQDINVKLEQKIVKDKIVYQRLYTD